MVVSIHIPSHPCTVSSSASQEPPLFRCRAHTSRRSAVRGRAAFGAGLVVGEYKRVPWAVRLAIDGRCGREVVVGRHQAERDIVAGDGMVLGRVHQCRATRCSLPTVFAIRLQRDTIVLPHRIINRGRAVRGMGRDRGESVPSVALPDTSRKEAGFATGLSGIAEMLFGGWCVGGGSGGEGRGVLDEVVDEEGDDDEEEEGEEDVDDGGHCEGGDVDWVDGVVWNRMGWVGVG